MDGRTNVTILKLWIEANGPSGMSRLAVRSGVSDSTIQKLRCGALLYPKRYSTRIRLCEAIGVDHNELFPGVENPGSNEAYKAS